MLQESRDKTVEKESAEMLPKMLPGMVYEQWRTCGKARCKCTRGELHGPYFYRFWREEGRLKKQYVPQAALQMVVAACNARRLSEMQRRHEQTRAHKKWQRLRNQLREMEEQWTN